MTRCLRVLLHSKHMQKAALKATENTEKKDEHIRVTKNPRRAGRAAKCRCRPAATLSRFWVRSCASSFWTSSSGSSGTRPYAIMAWQRLESLRWSRTLTHVHYSPQHTRALVALVPRVLFVELLPPDVTGVHGGRTLVHVNALGHAKLDKSSPLNREPVRHVVPRCRVQKMVWQLLKLA